MPSVAVKLYSLFFKLILKRRLQNKIHNPDNNTSSSFGVTSRPEESTAAVNPLFTDGVATKDIHIDPSSNLTIRIFLPDTCLFDPTSAKPNRSNHIDTSRSLSIPRRNSYGEVNSNTLNSDTSGTNRRSSYCNGFGSDESNVVGVGGVYRGYTPFSNKCRKLPLMVQFHGGGFVAGSCDSVANDFFCRRIAKVCDVIVVAVGYRLAPENKYPAAFEDGMKVLYWLGKQANLAECGKSLGGKKMDSRKSDVQGHVKDAFGASLVEPWLAAHGDPSR
ncbi:probable carboxylesterase 16 [Tanacetum coccineum]|uniref:Probable carboxylesterase 16 n=1 Tax=Tanacetum coccineum TaxID=301880 RepID=A0ABQ5A7I5_9ASTR